MKSLKALATTGLLGMFTMAVFAQDNGGGQQMMLRALDSNNDGSISLEEFSSGNAPMMSRIDADGNGFVTEAEFLANFRNMGNMGGGMRQGNGAGGDRQLNDEQRQQMMARMEEQAKARFAAMDKDGDNQVSMAEYRAGAFANMDRNQDGMLSGDELTMQGRGAMAGGRRDQ